MKIEFTLDGPLYGYRATVSRYTRKSDGTKRGGVFDPNYLNFKKLVLLSAMEKGWKGKAVSLPLWVVRLSVVVHWEAEARLDWSNCYKAVEDSLFSQDRHVRPGHRSDVIPFDGPERADVILEIEDTRK